MHTRIEPVVTVSLEFTKNCNKTSNILLKTAHTLYIIVQATHSYFSIWGLSWEIVFLINYFFNPQSVTAKFRFILPYPPEIL